MKPEPLAPCPRCAAENDPGFIRCCACGAPLPALARYEREHEPYPVKEVRGKTVAFLGRACSSAGGRKHEEAPWVSAGGVSGYVMDSGEGVRDEEEGDADREHRAR